MAADGEPPTKKLKSDNPVLDIHGRLKKEREDVRIVLVSSSFYMFDKNVGCERCLQLNFLCTVSGYSILVQLENSKNTCQDHVHSIIKSDFFLPLLSTYIVSVCRFQ